MLKVVELFAGIGAFRQAMKNLNIPHEMVGFSEIDKYAVEAYRAVHDDYITPNLGDITKIEELPSCDLLTYGFPCQDLSIAGHGKGIKEGTRSGLLLEVERLIDIAGKKEKLPKYLILENVKALVQKKHRKDFDTWLEKLESLGYTNYWQVLNAKDYGIPQNRERVFVVSILGEHKPYEFPEKHELKLRLRDLLDDEVPENYYLKDEKVQDFIEKYRDKIEKLKAGVYPCLTPDRLNKRQNGRRFKGDNEEMFTITAQDCHGVMKIGSLTDKNSQGERVYTTDIAVTQNATGGGLGAKTGLYLVVGGTQKNAFVGNGSYSPCLTSSMGTGGGHVPLIVGNINPCGHGHGGEVFSEQGIAPTLTTGHGEGPKIICHDVETSKKVRRHFLDAKKLRDLLVSSKKISNKEIAEKLNKNISTVEHWFRKDESWSIPDEKIWFKLKDLLDIKTSEFDRVLTEFDTLPSKFEKNNRFYDPKGLAPTITTGHGEGLKIIIDKEVSNCITTGMGRCTEIDRYVDRYVDRQVGQLVTDCTLRIRRLTPLECFRLMGFSDGAYYKAKSALEDKFYKGKDKSNSQMYKMAGNSIVVTVPEAIFEKLFEKEQENV